jgi:hypothetical protein
MERWDRTDIWHELEKKTGTDASAAEARKMLAHEMPRIELVLDKGGTSELDFTHCMMAIMAIALLSEWPKLSPQMSFRNCLSMS